MNDERIRDLPPTEVVAATFYLRRRPSEEAIHTLPAFRAIHPSRRGYLRREELVSRFGALPDDVSVVSKYLEPRHLMPGNVDLGRRTVEVSGPVSAWQEALQVRVGVYRRSGIDRIGYSGELVLPSELQERVVAVLGLDRRPMLRAHFRVAQPGAAGYSATQVGTAYSFPPALNGLGQTLGLLEFGGGYSPTDLQKYFEQAGIPMPTVSPVSVDGASNSPTGDPNGPDAEVELDIEIAGALAPAAQIVVYFAPNSEQGFIDALTTAIHDTEHHPSIVSVSWGGPEPTWSSQALTAFSQAVEDATSLGITVLAAAGDSGASDGEPAGTLAVDFPASGPYVLGCGGTRLLLSGTEITEEVVWNDLAEGEGATGGGVSAVFPLPSYQAGVGVPTGEGGFVGRGVPDVAGDADPETGYAIQVDGSSIVVGGTSAVAPLWAALVARVNQGLGAPVGFLQPLLYTPPEEATFHDITEGNNGGFDAGPGWDACTGWGSPDGAALLVTLQRSR